MCNKTTRQWSVSPNHQSSGYSPELMAGQYRQQFNQSQATLRNEASPSIALHPMDRVREWLGRMAHLGNLMHQNSSN